MQLKVQHVMDATLVISQIIRDQRPMPQKGKYRLARLHAKLFPEFKTINERRDDMIMAYQTHQTREVPDPENPGQTKTEATAEWMVPADKMDEFNAAWKTIADEVIDIDVQPMPLAYLDLGDAVEGSIQANELITLGELVTE